MHLPVTPELGDKLQTVRVMITKTALFPDTAGLLVSVMKSAPERGAAKLVKGVADHPPDGLRHQPLSPVGAGKPVADLCLAFRKGRVGGLTLHEADGANDFICLPQDDRPAVGTAKHRADDRETVFAGGVGHPAAAGPDLRITGVGIEHFGIAFPPWAQKQPFGV